MSSTSRRDAEASATSWPSRSESSERVALGHEQPEDPLAPERARAERGDDGAVDAAREPDDDAPPAQLAQHLSSNALSDLIRRGARVDGKRMLAEHGSPNLDCDSHRCR